MTKEQNTFEELEKQRTENKYNNNPNRPDIQANSEVDAIINAPGEIAMDTFSDTAVGEHIKYNRPDLDGKEDVIDKFQVMAINTEKDKIYKYDNGSEYWKYTAILTYASKNEDGVPNREYISGIKSFVQDDGTASDMKFWYDQPIERKKSQNIYIWELVAKKLNIKPDEMTPRQYMAFMNGRPKVKIVKKEYENFGAKKGEPAVVYKNMPGEFL